MNNLHPKSKHLLALLAGIIVVGGVITYIFRGQSETSAGGPVAVASTANAGEPPDSPESLADDAMKKLDTAFPGSPGANPPGVVVFGQSGARYILSPDSVTEFHSQDAAAPPSAQAQTYVARVTANTIVVDTNHRGTATTVVLPLPPPGTAPEQAPPLSVTTKNTSGAMKTASVPAAEYAKKSSLVKIADDGFAHFVLPDNGVSVKQGRIYNSSASQGSTVILEGDRVSFGNSTPGN